MMRRSADSFAIILAIASIVTVCNALDTITTNHIVNDGDTIVSSGGKFELGFFSPGSSKNRYLGIWYKNIPVKTVVWVANRHMPINTTFGALELVSSGVLNVFDYSNGLIMWSSNILKSVQNPVAQLLDNGNFVVREKDDKPHHFLWQSFDYPTDTLLAGMNMGKNFVTGLESYLSSWKNGDDPAPGGFTYRMDPTGYPHLVLRKGLVVMYRTGPWNGLAFNGRPKFIQTNIYTGKLIFNNEEVYYKFELNSSILSRFVLNGSGEGQRWIWVNRTQNWGLLMKLPTDNCDSYKWCGAYSSCNIANIPPCGCLEKFEPKDRDNWAKADWSSGCVRRKPLNCQKGDGFHKYSGVKVPDVGSSWFNESITLKECEMVCLKNCSCMAYASLKITDGGSGCLQWYGDLIDIRELSAGGQDLYVRVAYSESDRSKWRNGDKLRIIVSVSMGMILVGLSLAFYIWKEKKLAMPRCEGNSSRNFIQDDDIEGKKEDLELPFFCIRTLSHATNHFAFDNKLGQGGFGPVFKGVLQDGQEIAVKRLSETSKQGIIEFMNEVKCIAKLQHRNLVRLLGYCIQGMDRILVYEYMPNKSLDWHIFDETRSKLLDWPQRFHIIDGIARGLLYLHQDSRLRIIHRDLKAGNILLDKDMNPKISDFGLAKSIMENETASSTNRVVGTYGYMSPEYAVDGLFSIKSDVFSFGVLVLEIVSGSRNRGFINTEHRHNLLGHAWRLHKENRSLELTSNHTSMDSHYMPKVLRSIHIGLLCVQQFPEDRPNMSSVVLMLGGEGELPVPKKPGFFTERNVIENEHFPTGCPDYSCDAAATSTQLQGR